MSIPLLILALFGALLFAYTEGKLSETGKVIFFCALLALCFGSTPAHWGRLT